MRDRWRQGAALVSATARVAPGQTVLLGALVLLRSLAPVTFALAAAQVVAQVPATVRLGLSSPPGHRLLTALVVMGVAFAVQQSAPAVQLSVADLLGRRFTLANDRRLMAAAALPPGLGHLEDPQVAQQLEGARRAVGGWPRPGDAVNALAGRVPLHLAIVSGSLLLGAFHWWAAAVLLVVAWLLQGRVAAAMTLLGESQVGAAAALREPLYLRELALRAPAAKEIRIFGLGGFLVDRHAASWQRSLAELRAARAGRSRSLVLATLGLSAVLVALVGVLCWQVAHGSVRLAAVAVTLQGIGLVTRSLSDEGALRDAMVLGYAFGAQRMTQTVTEQLEAARAALPGSRPASGLPSREVRFEGVSFGYPGSDRQVLSGLDLSIPCGGSLGLVGLNGAGKTTLVKLLCRLYEPTAGRVTVDGTDLRELDAESWQRRIAAIFQDYARYPFTLAENVAAGQPDAARLDRVAQLAGLGPLLAQLPAGWQTPLGRGAAGAVDLSGGQWQRVALARALYAADAGAGLLILDEPTASLDVRGEAEVYEQSSSSPPAARR